MHAVCGPAKRVVPEAEQRRLVDGGHQPDVSAMTPITPVRAATVHMGLSAPRDRPGPSVASTSVQLGLIDEAGHSRPA